MVLKLSDTMFLGRGILVALQPNSSYSILTNVYQKQINRPHCSVGVVQGTTVTAQVGSAQGIHNNERNYDVTKASSIHLCRHHLTEASSLRRF